MALAILERSAGGLHDWQRRRMASLGLIAVLLSLSWGISALAETQLLVEVLDAWMSPPSRVGPWLLALKEDFEAEYPGVQVEYISSKGIDGLILAAASGTRSPDVVLHRVAWAQNAYKKGLVTPLTKYWEQSSLRNLTFFHTASLLGESEGVLYALPRALEAYTIIYNLEMFEGAGLDPDPEAILSWNDLVTAARRLHRTTGTGEVRVAGFTTGLNAPLSPVGSMLTAANLQ